MSLNNTITTKRYIAHYTHVRSGVQSAVFSDISGFEAEHYCKDLMMHDLVLGDIARIETIEQVPTGGTIEIHIVRLTSDDLRERQKQRRSTWLRSLDTKGLVVRR